MYEYLLFVSHIYIYIYLFLSSSSNSVDRLIQINAQHLNYETGYAQAAPKLANPVDVILGILQRVCIWVCSLFLHMSLSGYIYACMEVQLQYIHSEIYIYMCVCIILYFHILRCICMYSDMYHCE